MITHRIGVDVCFARQRTFFHKCHRCVYRGQPANWEPNHTSEPQVVLHPVGEPARTGVTEVELPLPGSAKPAAAGAKGRSGKAPKGKTAKSKTGKVGKAVEADA